ncbi:MAG: ComF family protein [Alphaproteobacteria bacterium]|nr:ComF family protein [Alphaproteobacteria bacterium]
MVKIIDALNSVLEFLYPATCPLCNARVSTHGELCADCWGEFHWIDKPKCAKCGYPFASDLDLGLETLCPVCAAGKCELDWIRSACVYDDGSKVAMLPFKHCGKTQYSTFMSRAMMWALRDVDCSAIDIVMPVPLAYKRLWHRGYNQATLLARPIARALGLKMDLESVRRKYRDSMGHKTAVQRAQNIRGVFNVVRPENLKDKNILLVDDVMTTGATFDELKRVLKRAGAKNIYGLTFCRVARTA